VTSPQKSTHKILIVSLFSVLILVALLMGCSSLPAMFPAQSITPTAHAPQVSNGLIVFGARLNNGYGSTDIYTMNSDGSDAQRLTVNPGDDYHPIWTPDGKQIIYISDETSACLDIMNFDGSDKHCIPFEFEGRSLEQYIDTDSFVWSPDGTKIAFSDGNPIGSTIFVMDSNGSDLHRMSPDNLTSFHPFWSMNSQELIFSNASYAGGHIHIANADGSNYRWLNDEKLPGISRPYWLRNNRIVFQAQDGIYIMDTDGGNIRRLLNQKSKREMLWGLSPDESKLLISIWKDDQYGIQAYLVIVDADDLSIIYQFENDASEDISWSPDSEQILYWAGEYHIVNIDGTGNRELITSFFSIGQLDWQPVWK
jgi:Tol biopolymer transport system component